MQAPLRGDLLEIAVTKSKTNIKTNRVEVAKTKTHFSVKVNLIFLIKAVINSVKGLFD